MKYDEHTRQDRRLVILRILQETPEYRLNDSVLSKNLAIWAHATSKSELLSDLAFLAANNLIKMCPVGDYQIAELLHAGQEVARGTTSIDGVSRPSASRG